MLLAPSACLSRAAAAGAGAALSISTLLLVVPRRGDKRDRQPLALARRARLLDKRGRRGCDGGGAGAAVDRRLERGVVARGKEVARRPGW